MKIQPTSTKEMRVKKVALWGLLISSTVVGSSVLGLYTAGKLNVSSAQSIIEQKEESPSVGLSAQAFAKEFAHEYFKWNVGLEEQRAKRLEAYLAKGLDPQAGINFQTIQRHARAEHIEVFDIKEHNKNKSTIYISAIVNYFNPKDQNDYFSKRQILAVPITVQSHNRFAVADLPYLIPVPSKANTVWKNEPLSGQAVINEQEVQNALESFFKVYTSGKDSEIQYLTKSDQPIHGFKGAMEFLAIEDLEVSQQGNQFNARALVRMKEVDSEVEMSVPYTIELLKENDRYFVTNLKQ